MIFRTITDDITGANKSIGLFGKSLNDIKGIINSFKQNGFGNTLLNTPLINIDTDAIDIYNNRIRSSIPFEQALSEARRTTNADTIALIESSHGAEVQIERVTAVQKVSTIAAKAHSAALKAVSTAGNMILFAAVTKGLELAAKSFDDYIHRAEKAKERTDELFSEFRKMNSSLADHRKTVSELAERYDKLAKGTDLSNNKNLSLSASEYEEFLNIILPDLVSRYRVGPPEVPYMMAYPALGLAKLAVKNGLQVTIDTMDCPQALIQPAQMDYSRLELPRPKYGFPWEKEAKD